MIQSKYMVCVTLCVCLLAGTLSAQEGAKTQYVCPPCGHDCMATIFDSSGSCGECGMGLITKSAALEMLAARTANSMTPEPKKVAILLFDGVQIIDYTGPWEIFGQAGFEVFTVSTSTDAIRTTFGMKVTPHYSLMDHPEPDIVMVPGGQVMTTQNDPEVRKWLNDNAEKADIVLSVCNGAYILAKAGILNGLKATTTRNLIDGLVNAAPNISVVRDTRFVDNGKVITSGGLSAGMDAALHVVSRIHDKQRAERIAYGLEYDWNPDGVVVSSKASKW